MLVPVILAGGAGTRLWPLSRQNCPKPFADLGLNETLFDSAYQRARTIGDCDPWVVCSTTHQSKVHQAAPSAHIVLEPAPRGTNSAIMLAAKAALEEHDDPLLMILSADHYLPDTGALQTAINHARALAHDHIVTFGVTPTCPHTGYGYIIPGPEKQGGHTVSAFTEKPNEARAKELVEQGALWNSGMFMVRAKHILEACSRLSPETLAHIGPIETREGLSTTSIYESPNVAFDYAILERSSEVAVVPFTGAWDDIGAFDSLYQHLAKDANGNAVRGDAIVQDCENSAVLSQNRLVCALGVKDTIVVETPDVVLVLDKKHAQSVKPLLASMGSRQEVTEYPAESRPWGQFMTIGQGPRYRVKKIIVEPGGRLSLQRHQHRAEHWVVVRGTATVTKNTETLTLTENESTFIPVGAVHRLENTGKIPLELIEVQSGAYLGEDDIERLEDVYGRAAASSA